MTTKPSYPLTLPRIATAIAHASGNDTQIWLSDNVGYRGVGRLLIRITKSTALFYFRHTRDRKRKMFPLGRFSRNAQPGYLTLEQARDAVHRLLAERLGQLSQSVMASAPEGGALLKPPKGADAAVVTRTSKATLKDVCRAYTDDLERRRRSSADSVTRTLAFHVSGTELALRPADEVTPEEVSGLLRSMVANGNAYMANKVRAHLCSAYNTAIASKLDPMQPASALFPHITLNPVREIKSLKGVSKPGQRALSEPELGMFLRMLQVADPDDESRESISKRVLRWDLYLGGQRGEQLVSVPLSRVDLDDNFIGVITLVDPKGKREVPRAHLLPIDDSLADQCAWFVRRARRLKSPWLLPAIIDPQKAFDQESLSRLTNRLSKEMTRMQKEIQPFKFNDLRRTAETLLAKLKVPKEVRAHLLSHGISGVQDIHYLRYEFMEEKREALSILHKRLDFLECAPYSSDLESE